MLTIKVTIRSHLLFNVIIRSLEGLRFVLMADESRFYLRLSLKVYQFYEIYVVLKYYVSARFLFCNGLLGFIVNVNLYFKLIVEQR